jgi:hypothetical protein
MAHHTIAIATPVKGEKNPMRLNGARTVYE